MALLPINSVLNTAVPAYSPDAFSEEPLVRAAVEMFIASFNNLQMLLEQYCGFTQKDMSYWNTTKPTDTLLMHQSRRFYVNNSNIKCTQALVFGDLVNVWNNAGVASVQKAYALAAGPVKRAMGICSTGAGIPIGGTGEIILTETLLPLAGVFPGDILYLSKVAQGGFVANVPPVAVGDLEQCVGFGLDNNLAYVHIVPGTYIQH